MAFNIIFTALSFSSETEKKESKNQKKRKRKYRSGEQAKGNH